MRLALNEAWKYQGLTYPNPAVGCCIVGKNGEILAVEAHKRAGEAHAEVEALKSAYHKLTNDEKILSITSSSDIHVYLINNHNGCFRGISIFTTLEPCAHIGKTPSCASLISKLEIKKLFVGSQDLNKIASGGIEIVKKTDIDVQMQLLEKECDELLNPFNMWSKKRFIFFKWAQRLNGTIDYGTISSKKSRTLVHAMRDVCDLLIIGGNSVRVDRPTLDARMVNGKAPDILIISKSGDFDKTIPLFNVKDRKVIISDNFSVLDNYKNIMIEGGSIMFNLTKDIVDYHLCFLSAQVGGDINFTGKDYKFDILNVQKDDKDIIMWMKQENSRGNK
ncbi:bifunctional diaminohydroxyphosphoribosylaminopyrimidine deaminase/5-amino-6-(5-phosphoribosylamino)uracil reductase RibD [Sulfurimonas sp. RIFOXYD12_FULL_33_39]|nr:bifunctional diaminohydroxyphosphoribosylaminopyrimidine deaminase/5-amino-6-(5-phosphoribosylamino)uracil reductase RibD [Sulfurimonas sp. RIFOXYD12_FULL_33_39]